LSICVTREEAVRAELASRVSFEASCVASVTVKVKRVRADAITYGADEFVEVYFTEVFQGVLDLREPVF
jgi:hypothetical protein